MFDVILQLTQYYLFIYAARNVLKASLSVATEHAVIVNADATQPDELQEVKVKIISTEVCSQTDWYGKKFDEMSMVCAGYKEGDRDACGGDSGGPLACRSPNGRYKLFGVVSWGEHCGKAKHPGAYATTASVLDWIKTYVEGAHTCTYYFVCPIAIHLLLRRKQPIINK